MHNNEYLPLFRKYRPQCFEDVIGQEFTVRALENAVKLNKIANAYLFCGPRGTGKTSCARIFAKSLNCKQGPTIKPCQQCQSCLDVTNASGLDVVEIDAATNRGIDDAKELISKTSYAPMNGKYKIFIIDEVHMLSKEAFNALLKTFEEPPKNVIFILATTEPHKVIETIVSRCQRFDFKRITIDDIITQLRKIAGIENINITDDALFAIAKNVSGGLRDSLALLDQASVLGLDGQIDKQTIEMLTGKLTFEVLYDLTQDILNSEIQSAVARVEKIYEKGLEPRNFVENYIEFLRNVILIKNSFDDEISAKLTLIDKCDIEKIKSNDSFKKDCLIFILNKAVEYFKEIKSSTNPYLWAEIMVISAAAGNIDTSLSINRQEILDCALLKPVENENMQINKTPIESPAVKNMEHLEITGSNCKQKEADLKLNSNETPLNEDAPLQNKENKTVYENNRQPLNDAEAAKIWAEIINKIDSIPAKFFYSGVGKLVEINSGCIKLGFVNQNAIAQAKSDNKYKPLMKAITAVLGESAAIEFITAGPEIKIIETKLNVKTVQNPSAQTFYNSQNNKQAAQIQKKQNQVGNFQANNIYSRNFDEEEINTQRYSPLTAEMLKTFNGRVVD